jgi:hypothetical protein
MTSADKPRLAQRISAAMARPLFGTRVIPHNARVDPALFPEEEFVIHCGKCGYNLRGLPDGPCPECGTPFERARELVLAYVHNPIGRIWWKTSCGRWLIRFSVLGLVAVGLELGRSIPYWYLLWRSGRTGGPPPKHGIEITNALSISAYGLEIAAFLAILCCVFFFYRGFKQVSDKRRRVIEAIPPSPSH